jgi:hypothetical protein
MTRSYLVHECKLFDIGASWTVERQAQKVLDLEAEFKAIVPAVRHLTGSDFVSQVHSQADGLYLQFFCCESMTRPLHFHGSREVRATHDAFAADIVQIKQEMALLPVAYAHALSGAISPDDLRGDDADSRRLVAIRTEVRRRRRTLFGSHLKLRNYTLDDCFVRGSLAEVDIVVCSICANFATVHARRAGIDFPEEIALLYDRRSWRSDLDALLIQSMRECVPIPMQVKVIWASSDGKPVRLELQD